MICLPSGDQSGWLSAILVGSGVCVNCTAWLPSACMSQRSTEVALPSGRIGLSATSYTILLPSGDHLAPCAPLHTPVQEVSCVWPVPSAFITQTLPVPLARTCAKRILEPSGDQSALPSCTPWRGWVSWRTSLPSALAEKIAAVFWSGSESPARRCVLSTGGVLSRPRPLQSQRCCDWPGAEESSGCQEQRCQQAEHEHRW